MEYPCTMCWTTQRIVRKLGKWLHLQLWGGGFSFNFWRTSVLFLGLLISLFWVSKPRYIPHLDYSTRSLHLIRTCIVSGSIWDRLAPSLYSSKQHATCVRISHSKFDSATHPWPTPKQNCFLSFARGKGYERKRSRFTVLNGIMKEILNNEKVTIKEFCMARGHNKEIMSNKRSQFSVMNDILSHVVNDKKGSQ